MRKNIRALKLYCSRLMVKAIVSITSMLKVFKRKAIQSVHHYNHSRQQKSIAKTDRRKNTIKKMDRLDRRMIDKWVKCLVRWALRGATYKDIMSSRSSH